MPIDIFIIVAVTAFVQSIFGVGVLLFGTPALLLLGYDFINALGILLPISIAINLLQVIKHYQYIDHAFYKKILLFSVPFVVICLFIVSSASININGLIGILLILVALKSFFPFVEDKLKKIVQCERSYLVAMGTIHGLTNLGGALLTAIVHTKPYGKHTTRVTVAVCYVTFAVFQLITLFAIGSQFDMSYSNQASLLQVGVIVFLLTEELVYQAIDDKRYGQFFGTFLLISGFLLIIK